jgi:hypothetical protein
MARHRFWTKSGAISIGSRALILTSVVDSEIVMGSLSFSLRAGETVPLRKSAIPGYPTGPIL